MILLGLMLAGLHYMAVGALPRPFNSDPSQSLMDLYNTAYWAHRGGAYDLWHTVYPPLSLLFAQTISQAACYAGTPFEARLCDPGAAWVILAFYVLNISLVFAAFRRAKAATALPRTLALCLGLPTLYGLELANLIIPCFSAFVLAEGGLVRPPWLRHLFRALALNFKLYLLVLVLPFVLQRRFRWLIGAAVASLGVYLVSFLVYGDGTPWQILYDLLNYAQAQPTIYSEENHLQAVSAASQDVWGRTVAVVLRLGEGVALLGLLVGLWSRGAGDRRRLAALALSVLCTEAAMHTQGFSADYTQMFLIFLLFLERRWTPPSAILTVMAYLLCVTADLTMVIAVSLVRTSFFSGELVRVDYGLTISQFLRPLIIVLIQLCLTWTVVGDNADRLLAFGHSCRSQLKKLGAKPARRSGATLDAARRPGES